MYNPPLAVQFLLPCVDTWRTQLSIHLCIDLHAHIPPQHRSLPATDKPVAAINETGFTTGCWKSLGGLAPPAHCNLHSSLLCLLLVRSD